MESPSGPALESLGIKNGTRTLGDTYHDTVSPLRRGV